MSLTADNVKRSRRLSKKLESTSRRINKIIDEIATSDNTTNVYWSKLQRQLNKEYETLRAITRNWIGSNMPPQYNESIRQAISKIKSKANNPRTDIKYTISKNTNTNRQSLQSIMSETLSTFDTGYTSGSKTLTRLLRTTQQINVQEAQINKSIEKGIIETGSVSGPIKNLQKDLMKKSLDGKYITVIDKNGDPIRYKPQTYAEMVARVKLQEASNIAALNTAQEVGTDLVQWSAHNTKCQICAPYEGKIYSISGNSKVFPKLTAVPPLHPNCLHTMTPVFEEALVLDGTYKDYVKFSNNEVGTHPTRKSFIPVSKRELT